MVMLPNEWFYPSASNKLELGSRARNYRSSWAVGNPAAPI